MKPIIPYKIEKRVPRPKVITRGPYVRYPFAEMKVGDSFFLAAKHGCDSRGGNALRAAAAYHAKRHPQFRFSVFTVKGGWRR